MNQRQAQCRAVADVAAQAAELAAFYRKAGDAPGFSASGLPQTDAEKVAKEIDKVHGYLAKRRDKLAVIPPSLMTPAQKAAANGGTSAGTATDSGTAPAAGQ